MRRRRKRLFSCLLVLLLLFSLGTTLAGCDKTGPAITELLPAAEKLKTASSYRLRVVNTVTEGESKTEETWEYLVEKAEDGTGRMYHRYEDASLLDEDVSYYYEGTESYVWYEYFPEKRVDKIIRDTSFSITDQVHRLGLAVRYDEGSTLALIDGMNPTRTKQDDGSLLLERNDLTAEQVEQLFAALNRDGFSPADGIGVSVAAGTVSGRIRADGYLQEVVLSYTLRSETEETQVQMRFVIDQVNDTTVEKPDFVKQYTLENEARVVYIQGDQEACYGLETDEQTGEETLCFIGFDNDDSAAFVVEQYTVLSAVEGLPVVSVRGVLPGYNPGSQVKRLVIPAGMKVDFSREGYKANAEETELYFEDAEEQVDKNFFLPGEETDSETAAYVKAAYYAGQWEYVDGIATPVK